MPNPKIITSAHPSDWSDSSPIHRNSSLVRFVGSRVDRFLASQRPNEHGILGSDNNAPAGPSSARQDWSSDDNAPAGHSVTRQDWASDDNAPAGPSSARQDWSSDDNAPAGHSAARQDWASALAGPSSARHDLTLDDNAPAGHSHSAATRQGWTSDDDAPAGPGRSAVRSAVRQDWTSDDDNALAAGHSGAARRKDWSSDANEDVSAGVQKSHTADLQDWGSDTGGNVSAAGIQLSLSAEAQQFPPPDDAKVGTALAVESVAESITRIMLIARDETVRQHGYALAGATNYEELEQNIESRINRFLARTPKPPPKKRSRKK